MNWKARINQVLGLGGLQLSRLNKAPPKGYYRASATCQIPNLSTIYENILGERDDGFFVEVGTFDGDSFSNVSCLADRGWAGVMVEPVPEFADKAAARHAGNKAVKLVRTAVGRQAGTTQITVAGALSTASKDMVETYQGIDWARRHVQDTRSISVPVTSLDDLLNKEDVPPGFDVLVIDTEGFESEVLAGFTINRWKPRLIIIELADFHPDMSNRKEEDRQIGRDIAAAGYEIIYKDHINTVFNRRAD